MKPKYACILVEDNGKECFILVDNRFFDTKEEADALVSKMQTLTSRLDRPPKYETHVVLKR